MKNQQKSKIMLKKLMDLEENIKIEKEAGANKQRDRQAKQNKLSDKI